MKLSLKKVLKEIGEPEDRLFKLKTALTNAWKHQVHFHRQGDVENRNKAAAEKRKIMDMIKNQFGEWSLERALSDAEQSTGGTGDPDLSTHPTPEQVSKIKQTQNVYNRGQEKMKRLNSLQKRWGTTPAPAPDSSQPTGFSTTAGRNDTDMNEPNTTFAPGTRFIRVPKKR